MKCLLVLGLITMLATPAFTGEKAPAPAKLRAAKKAMLVNNGVQIKAFDTLYSELKKWKRFEIVEDKSAADVVIALSPGGKEGTVAGVLGKMIIAGDISMLALNIVDAKNDSSLWADQNEPGAFTGYSWATKQLVKRLRERMGKN